jgi:hypothetical protein
LDRKTQLLIEREENMMKMKKWIALALSAAMCLTLLASCGRPSDNANNNSQPPAENSQPAENQGSSNSGDPIVIRPCLKNQGR